MPLNWATIYKREHFPVKTRIEVGREPVEYRFAYRIKYTDEKTVKHGDIVIGVNRGDLTITPAGFQTLLSLKPGKWRWLCRGVSERAQQDYYQPVGDFCIHTTEHFMRFTKSAAGLYILVSSEYDYHMDDYRSERQSDWYSIEVVASKKEASEGPCPDEGCT